MHRWFTAAFGAVAVALGLGLLVDARGTNTAIAVTANQDIASAGPLTHVYIGADLSCQIAHTGDAALELFPSSVIPGDCGTLLVTGGALYAPDFVSHGATATGSLGTYTPFTPGMQSAVTGTGTAVDPFTVITVADAGTTGLKIIEKDTYVVGTETYRTDVTVQNHGQVEQSVMLYRAGDCFLGSSDSGFGVLNAATKAIGCTKTANNTPPDRIEVWSPITPADHFYETDFDTIWARIGTKTNLPDTCDCAVNQDNGAAIEWDRTIPVNGDVTFSHFTTFSPLGAQPLVASKTADASSAAPGGSDGYTITISNPNAAEATVTSISDTLPAGFTYTAGSTTGVTTADPAIASQTLTWSGSFAIPGGGNITLHFNVTVASTPGTFLNSAAAVSSTDDVVPTGDTAPITIGGNGTPTSTATSTATPPEGATETATATTTPAAECETPQATGTAQATRTAHATRSPQATSSAVVTSSPASTSSPEATGSPATSEALHSANEEVHATQVHGTQTVHATGTVLATRTAVPTQTETPPCNTSTATVTPTTTPSGGSSATTTPTASATTPPGGGGGGGTASPSPSAISTSRVTVTTVASPSPSPSVVSGVLGAAAGPGGAAVSGSAALPNAGQGPRKQSDPNYLWPIVFLLGGFALIGAGVYRPRRR